MNQEVMATTDLNVNSLTTESYIMAIMINHDR